MGSISAIARVMISYTDGGNPQTGSNMLACIVNSRHATPSCKIYMSHLPPQAQIYLCPGPVSSFHEIGFRMGRDA